MRSVRTIWISALGLALLAAAPGLATEEHWQLRVGAPWVDSGLDYRETEDDGTTVQVLGQSGYGFGIALERRYNERLGWEFGVTWNRADVDLRIVDPLAGSFVTSDQTSPLTVTAGPDIHLISGSRADLYFGPLVAYVLYNDLTFAAQGQRLRVAVDNSFAWGGVVGLDIPFGDQGWYFCSSVRFLEADADVTPEGDPTEVVTMSTDPLMVAVGFGYRF